MLDIVEGVTEKNTIHRVVLKRTTVTEVCEDVVTAMLNGLPEEAHSI